MIGVRLMVSFLILNYVVVTNSKSHVKNKTWTMNFSSILHPFTNCAIECIVHDYAFTPIKFVRGV
jgi:hypothetical protein